MGFVKWATTKFGCSKPLATNLFKMIGDGDDTIDFSQLSDWLSLLVPVAQGAHSRWSPLGFGKCANAAGQNAKGKKVTIKGTSVKDVSEACALDSNCFGFLILKTPEIKRKRILARFYTAPVDSIVGPVRKYQ